MRSRIALILIALPAIAMPIGLGVWQLHRREWKTSLLTRFEAGLSSPAAPYQPPQTGSAKAREFMRVRVKGELLEAGTARLMTAAPDAARVQSGEDFGYVLFTPLKFAGGAVFVNRGFVPLSLAASPELFPKGETEVTGIVRIPEKPGWMTPAADFAKRLFFAADIPAMAAAAGLEGAKVIEGEYIQAEPSPGGPEWPRPLDPKKLLAAIPNDHLEYAITWFCLAAGAAGVFGLLIVRA